jgi:hypothetical protein
MLYIEVHQKLVPLPLPLHLSITHSLQLNKVQPWPFKESVLIQSALPFQDPPLSETHQGND